MRIEKQDCAYWRAGQCNGCKEECRYSTPEKPMDMEAFICQYGYHGATLLIGRFIELAPEFKGDQELARELGKMAADLESALRSLAGF